MVSNLKINKIISFFLFLSIFVSLGFNEKIIESGTPIYLSQIIFTILYAIYFISFLLVGLFSSKKIEINILFLSFILFFIFYASFGVSLSGNSMNEVIKFSFFLFSIWIFIVLFSSFEIDMKTLMIVVLISFFAASLNFISEYNILNINPENRLDSSRLGGYNTFALLMSQAMLICIHLLFNSKNLFFKTLLLISFLFFLLTLFLTFSRGGVFSFIIGATYYLYKTKRKRYFFLVPLSALVLFQFYDLSFISNIEDIVTRYTGDSSSIGEYSTGRISLWIYLIQDISSNFIDFIFGKGIGTIAYDSNTSWTITKSAHNQYLEYFYSFGLLVFFIFVTFLVNIGRKLIKFQKEPFDLLIHALFIQIIFSLFVDSHLQASQVGWYFGMLIAVFYFNANKKLI